MGVTAMAMAIATAMAIAIALRRTVATTGFGQSTLL